MKNKKMSPLISAKPQIPFPIDLSISVRFLEERLKKNFDDFFPVAQLEKMDILKYQILAGGIKNNMKNFEMDENIWNNLKNLSGFVASGNSNMTYNIVADFDYRIHVEGLRLVTVYPLMDILYKGEICVSNEFDKTDHEFHFSICKKIWDLYQKNPKLDLTALTLKDLKN